MENRLPVCPTNVLLQSGQISLQTPDRENLSWVWRLWVSRLLKVLVVRNAILSSVRRKMLVIYEVSLPRYVKVAHFCFERGSTCFLGLWVGVLCVFIGKEVLCRMLWMMYSSCRYSSCCRL
jgi:hypothetical protein